jgi:iron complex transport system substrate-binding protein
VSRLPGRGRPGARRGHDHAVLAAVVALLVAVLASPVSALTLTDMTGRALTMPAPPRRIVSLVPSATEIIFALGGEDRLVGVTDFCDFPPAARRKRSVGGMIAPNLEIVSALTPDLVIATREGNRHETFEQIGRLGIPVYLVEAGSIGEMLDAVARLGALTGRTGAVAPLAARLGRRVRAVSAAVKDLRRPRVLYVLWPDPLIVPARASLLTELIGLAGGESITGAEAGDYPRFSIEAAVARAPEVIILADHGSGTGLQQRGRWERLKSLPAVRAGRLHSVDGSVLHRYGPRVVDGLEQLARAIHPEAFR